MGSLSLVLERSSKLLAFQQVVAALIPLLMVFFTGLIISFHSQDEYQIRQYHQKEQLLVLIEAQYKKTHSSF